MMPSFVFANFGNWKNHPTMSEQDKNVQHGDITNPKRVFTICNVRMNSLGFVNEAYTMH